MNYSILLGDYLTFHHKYEITHFFFITLVLKRIQSRINTSSIFAKSSAGLISSNSSSTRLFTPLLFRSKQGCERHLGKPRTGLGFKLKFISLSLSRTSLQSLFSFLSTKSLSWRAAYAEAGRGVGEAGGVDIEFISLFIVPSSGSIGFRVSSGKEADRGFLEKFSMGCQTDEARGTHNNCPSTLSLSGKESVEHNFLFAGGVGRVLCIANNSSPLQLLQYVLLCLWDG